MRITWADLPDPVRAWVADEVGEVLDVRPQQGGFSPGTADRVRGRRGSAFVKAAGEQLNPHTPGLIAREATVLEQLPRYAGAPVLLASLDEGIEGERWVALLVEDIDGRHPRTPWEQEEVGATLRALEALADRPLPETVQLPRLDVDLAGDLSCWPDLLADPPEDLDPWASERLDLLADLAAEAPRRLHGEHLVHNDIRADNLLVDDAGAVRVVDWPWACRGAAWFDTLNLLLNLRLLGGPEPTAYEGRLSDLGATRNDVDSVLAALCGFFLHTGRLPPPPGLPTVRAFQQAHGRATLAWLRERLGD